MRKLCLCLAAAFLLPLLFALAGCAEGDAARSRYEIDAVYDGGVLTAALDFTYYNDTESSEMTSLRFNLFGNAYREGAVYAPVSPAFRASAYYNGESWGEMNVLSVTPCAAWEVCGEDENVLRVDLAAGVFPGESAQLRIEYELRLAEVDHRTGITRGGTVNLGNFYPVLCVYDARDGFYECVYSSNGDPFYSACADYRVTLTADADYTVAASGEEVASTVSGGRATRVYALQNARDFAFVLGRSLRVAAGQVDGVAVSYYYTDDPSAERTLALLCESVAYFGHTFGDYPYKTYSAVQTGFCYGGMEYPGLALLSDSLTGADYGYTAVHETAHQWWYAAVGSNQVENAWMDEGLAEYSSVLFYEAHPAYGLTREGLVSAARSAYGAYYTVWNQVFGAVDTSMDRPLGEYGEYEYVAIAYNKGLLLFDTLRDALGEDRFLRGLRAYYAACAGRIALPEELAAAWNNGAARGIVLSFVDGTAVL